MYLDYSKWEFDSYERPEVPELVLQTLSSEELGIISGVTNLKFNIKLSEPSEMTFDVTDIIDDGVNPLYSKITGHKLIYTKNYGIYVILNPAIETTGIGETKHVTGYSLEKTLEKKTFFIEQGTFNFWNPVQREDTILGRILEVAPGWGVGYVSPSLIGRYRTFDSYDDYLLSFIYNDAPEKYRCYFVFDVYKKTINVYDSDEERSTLPIYLDFENLLESVEVEEVSDELITAIRPYGADELDIRNVNPIGTNWLYDISYFIANGDIPPGLAEKWKSWQYSILNNQSYYKGLIGLRSSATARLLTEQAALTDLNGELEDLTNQQSITIQTLAKEMTDDGKKSQQELLDQINANIAAKKEEISAKETVIADIQSQISGEDPSSYGNRISEIVNELAITNYFTQEEYAILANYFIESDLTDETFVATDLNTSASGISYPLAGSSVSIANSAITEVDLTEYNKKMYVITGGTLDVTSDKNISGDIIRGTLEVNTDNSFVMSFYIGSTTIDENKLSSGMLTFAGSLSDMTSDISPVTKDDITTLEGSQLVFEMASGTMYITVNISDYQKYSIQMEMFDHFAGVLSDVAIPTYEFTIDSANFLFSQEFAPFRNKLELGKGVYLNLGKGLGITPYIIEFEIDFEQREHFSLVFSNRFKRHDNVNTIKDMIESSYSSGRSFDSSKYVYNQTVSQAAQVANFMQASINAAVNKIVAASNQSVVINGAGIHVGGDSKYQIRIVDNMIAMTDDAWQTAKVGIGLFASPEIGEYWGVNADVLAGKLLVGQNMVIEHEGKDGVSLFKFDGDGAYLHNASLDIVSSKSNTQIMLDPVLGFAIGEYPVVSTDDDGNEAWDEDKAKFWVDAQGNVHFKGKLEAADGYFSGELKAAKGTFEGNLEAAEGSFAGTVTGGDIKIGPIKDSSGNITGYNFVVDKDGKITALSGDFKGDITGSTGTFSGTVSGGDIKIGPIVNSYGNITGYKFTVDKNGNVTATDGSFVNGSFSGSLNGATGTFSGTLQSAELNIDGIAWETNDWGWQIGTPTTYGKIRASKNAEDLTALEVVGLKGIRILSNENIFLQAAVNPTTNSGQANIVLSNDNISLNGGLYINADIYGTSLPSGTQPNGRVFFKLKS